MKLLFAAVLALSVAMPAPLLGQQITLEQIMADPEWIGRAPENPYWADDAATIYFSQKREGEDERDLHQIDLTGELLQTIADEDRSRIDSRSGDYSADWQRKLYSRNGDLFIKDIAIGELIQLTRTNDSESSARFMLGDDRITFRRGSATLIRELATGFEYQPADLRASDDPQDEKDPKPEYLKDQQERLFEIVQKNKQKRELSQDRSREKHEADPLRVPPPFYLGKGNDIRGTYLSPDARYILVRIAKKNPTRAKADSMPNYVTNSGYVESRSVRSKVGTGKLTAEKLMLLNLETHEQFELDLSVLPLIADDPLALVKEEVKAWREEKMKAENAEQDAEDAKGDQENEEPEANEEAADEPGQPDQPDEPEEEKKPEKEKPAKPRPISIRSITWSKDSSRVFFQAFSDDNKDRWLATVDLVEHTVIPLEHDRDEAWINWRATPTGWLRDNHTIWFMSERDGYANIYLRDTASESQEPNSAQRIAGGDFVISSVRLSRDGQYLYYTANASHPGIYEYHRVNIEHGESEQLTNLGGINRTTLSPDETKLLITHSTTLKPPELYIQDNRPGAEATRLTHTISDQFASMPWIEPTVVEVPSRHGRPIYSRIYTPDAQPVSLRPAVVFIHGAGYLQNAHHGWSNYFREFMFHTLLVNDGYVVLDMDYRASAGYGRDWRTAIYRQMGIPELEDLQDGVKYLAANHNVDPARIGVYGGSYGGFLTLMALFTQPDLFACGAALRPVTDWAHYNNGYTSNILNTPEIDPIAYERSSPIEFAEGLENPLLMCHGMQDDNVFFQDTIRLAQRLIELKKEDWEVALFPIEPHGFKEPTSWLNEYRRIRKLFRENLEQ